MLQHKTPNSSMIPNMIHLIEFWPKHQEVQAQLMARYRSFYPDHELMLWETRTSTAFVAKHFEAIAPLFETAPVKVIPSGIMKQAKKCAVIFHLDKEKNN